MTLPAESSAAHLAELIARDFYENRLDLSARNGNAHAGWEAMPAEVEGTGRLRASGASEQSVRRFLTFVCAMDRNRPAVPLWRAGAALFEAHPEVFDPRKASAMPLASVAELLRASGVSRKHGPDSDAWHRIAHSLASGQGAVRDVVERGVGDAVEIRHELHSRRNRKRFPLLRGPKIGPMWLRIMANPGGAQIRRMDVVPVAVDVHVRRVTENLGVAATKDSELDNATPRIQSAWRAAVAKADIGGPPGIERTCAALDPALWYFSLHGCKHCEDVGMRVPIGRACAHCQFPAPSASDESGPPSA